MNEWAGLMRSLGMAGFVMIVLNVIFPHSTGLPGLVETAAFWVGLAFVLIQVPFWLRTLVRRRARVSPPEADAADGPASPPDQQSGQR